MKKYEIIFEEVMTIINILLYFLIAFGIIVWYTGVFFVSGIMKIIQKIMIKEKVKNFKEKLKELIEKFSRIIDNTL